MAVLWHKVGSFVAQLPTLCHYSREERAICAKKSYLFFSAKDWRLGQGISKWDRPPRQAETLSLITPTRLKAAMLSK